MSAASSTTPARVSTWTRARGNPAIIVGTLICLVLVAMAVFAPWVAPFDPNKQMLGTQLDDPSAKHWFGLDSFGRDVFSRIVYGARISLWVGVVATLMAMVLGTVIGIVAGYFGGTIDRVITMVTDVLLSFPQLVMGLLLVAVLGASLTNIIIAIAVTAVPAFIRLARGSTLAMRERDFIDAGRSLGFSDARIMFMHVLPNIMDEIIVMGSVALSVKGLNTEIRSRGTWYQAVRDVSFDVRQRETIALVGESGCGKSLTALSIMSLLPKGVGRMASGTIEIEGDRIDGASDAQMEKVRGNRIGMVFQEPMTSLNPVLQVGFQIAEPLIYHKGMSRKAARDRAVELMELVRIPSAAERLDAYPHQFSGGMRQRVMIAIALACAPKVLIADEPTTALDVTIQAQVLALLAGLQKSADLAVLLITHNLGVVASVADRVLVMYGGDVVESAEVRDLFARPTHPYTSALLAAMPRADRSTAEIAPIPGTVPPLPEMPAGCRFQSRCPLRVAKCAERPPLSAIDGTGAHQVRCWVKGSGV